MKEHIIQFKQRVNTNLLKTPFYQCVFYSVAIVSSNKNKSKSGDITWHSNFGGVLLIVVNREVNNIQRGKKRKLSGDFLSIRCERGGFAAKDMRFSDRQSYCVWPDSTFSICSSIVRGDMLGIFQ